MHTFGFAGDLGAGSNRAALRAQGYAAVSGTDLQALDATESPLPRFLAGRGMAESPEMLLTVTGTPWWDVPGRGLASAQPAELLDAYRAQGTGFFERLRGRFALAIIDAQRSRVCLAIDPMGIERLTWASKGGAIVFSDSAAAVAKSAPIRASLRPQAFYDYLLLHMVPSPDTAFEGVRKLEPGTYVVFENGRATEHRYWRPQFDARTSQSREALTDALHTSLAAAVQRCQPDARTGSFLSGGLDSSTVTGVLTKTQGVPAQSFSIGFGVDSHDELDFARITARHFGCRAVEYNVTPEDIVAAFSSIAAAYDEPFGNSSAVPTLFCAKVAAEHGLTHLLAGDGGDEIFGGNERYAKQQVFELWWRLPAALRAGLLEPLAQRMPNGLTPLRKFRSYVEQAAIPMPERLETWNYFHRTPAETVFEPELLSNIDRRAPIRRMDAVYTSAGTSDMLDRMLHYDWHYTLADNDLRKVGTMCALAGIRVSYPVLDPQVIEVSLQVPSDMKMEGRELRSFFKRAMAGFLPREVLEKKKHGFGLPFGVWLKTHAALRELIFDHLSGLAGRRIVRRPFIDALVQGHASGEPGYYGYAIWDLAMLEGWLRARYDSAAGVPY
jgi:asparagine synthase (glutamine-hydrolysing)